MAMPLFHLKEFIEIQMQCLNLKHFDGVLKFTVEIAKREKRHTFASCVLSDQNESSVCVVRFNPVMANATIGELECVINHEMIHVAQAMLDYKLDHGRTFRDLAKRFDVPTESSVGCAGPKMRTVQEMKAGVPARL